MSSVKKPYLKGYKYRIYPNQDQIHLLENTFGCCRFVYNRILAIAIAEYEYYKSQVPIKGTSNLAKPSVTGFTFVNKLPYLKSNPEYAWLNNVSSVALQQSLLDLGVAFGNFFRIKKGYPNFKKKSNHQSFRLMSNGFKLEKNTLYVSKCKTPIKVKWSRDLPSRPSQCTISRTPSGKYYVSFLCEYAPKQTKGTKTIGIDLGIKDFATLSDGTNISNPKYYESKLNQLKRLQQSLARKQKGSNNRNKARLKVAKLHEHISNVRKDFLHKLTRTLINENQVIGIEGLKVSNMIRNQKLSKSISSVAWGMFKTFLAYKANESMHAVIVEMDGFYPSSHICHKCHTLLDRKLKLSERSWECPICGEIHDRDINAAKNLEHVADLEYQLFKYKECDGKDVPRYLFHTYSPFK